MATKRVMRRSSRSSSNSKASSKAILPRARRATARSSKPLACGASTRVPTQPAFEEATARVGNKSDKNPQREGVPTRGRLRESQGGAENDVTDGNPGGGERRVARRTVRDATTMRRLLGL